MVETIAAAAIALASFFGASVDTSAQVACNIAADYYGPDIVCAFDGETFEVFTD